MTASERLTSCVIRDEAAWEAIRGEWDDLYAASPSASPPLDFVWLRRWWNAYGETYGPRGIRIVTVRRDGRLIAVAPFYLSSGPDLRLRLLRFMSTGEAEEEETCPEYLDLLCLPGDEAACTNAVWSEVRHLSWDCLELLTLSADSVFLRAGTLPAKATISSRDACAIADLTSGFEAYVESLSTRNRKRAKRLLREGERADARLDMVGPDRAGEAFDDLVRLHRERWAEEGKSGAFAAQRFTTFHRGLIEEWLPRGRAVLARMYLSEEPVAVLYGFITGQKFDFYQSGVRRTAGGSVESPGILAILLLMRALAERGVTTFDFLGGPAVHKQRMSNREQAMAGIQLSRPTPRTVACQLARWATRVFRRRADTERGTLP
jgi:CelD/BcsL family acetyltransferase involved in cellulose biosynthesis